MDGEATVSTERMEARLLRWGENNKGQTVTFQIHEDIHPFKGYASGDKSGQRFILVVAPIDDNEENVPTEAAKRKAPEPAPKERTPFHELSRAQQAGILCADPRFQRWCQDTKPMIYNQSDAEPQDKAAHFVRYHCGVQSRAGLDTGEAARWWDQMMARYREETQLPEQR